MDENEDDLIRAFMRLPTIALWCKVSGYGNKLGG